MKVKYFAATKCKGEHDPAIEEKVQVQNRLGLSSVIIQSADEMFTGEEVLKMANGREEWSTPMRPPKEFYDSEESMVLDAAADAWLALNELGDCSEASSMSAEKFAQMLERLTTAKTVADYRTALAEIGTTFNVPMPAAATKTA